MRPMTEVGILSTSNNPKDDEPDDRIYFDTWIENQFGEKVIVGKASVPVGPGGAN